MLMQTYGSGNARNPGIALKESLIAMALFGYGNRAVDENPELRRLFEEFEHKLRLILPEDIGFQRLVVRMPDVILVTSSGEFSLDAMSGGINSLFAITWQIHMYNPDGAECTVVIDEPENHLHPSMQRTLLPSLAEAFPDHRFIVSTHSPFIVTSDPMVKVFGLTRNSAKRIISQHLQAGDLAASPDDVLRDILDVPTVLPVWVERRLKEIFSETADEPDIQARVDRIYTEMRELGLRAASATAMTTRRWRASSAH